MDDRDDLETFLRRAPVDLPPGVRRTALDAYRRAHGRPSRWWRRPVPLYAAAILALVLTGVGMTVGALLPDRGAPGHARGPEQVRDEQLTWTPAVRDQLSF